MTRPARAWVILCTSVVNRAPTPESHQLVLVRVGRRRCARRQAELREDVAEMPSDGLLAQAEGVGDRAIRFARGDEREHLAFPPRQSSRPGWCRSMHRLLDPRELARRAEPLKYP